MTEAEFLKIESATNEDRLEKNGMMPWYRKIQVPSAKTLEGAKKAAVLVHVFQGDQDLEVLFMKRPSYDGTHGGQVSFPGGRREPEDASYLDTALREAEEEVGLKREDITVVRALRELYIPPSNFLVYPFVSFSREKPELILDEREVAYAFTVPIEELKGDKLVSKVKVPTKIGRMSVPAYVWEEEVIWGATAIITAECMSLLS